MTSFAAAPTPCATRPLRYALQAAAELALAVSLALLATQAGAAPVFTVFESVGDNPGDITGTRDAFRAAVGGGNVAGANGSFGGLRREINWDAVPAGRSDPNALPGNFFNLNSPRGAVFSTPGTGFMVSANAGGSTPTLFGFGNDFQTFSPQKLFTAVGSNITDVTFFLPGTATRATTSAFAAIFTDVEEAGSTFMEFFDLADQLIFSRHVLHGDNQGLSFLGAIGAPIARVRIQSGDNTILGNGVLGNGIADLVAMDDFLYAEPVKAVPEPAGLALAGVAALGLLASSRRRRGRLA